MRQHDASLSSPRVMPPNIHATHLDNDAAGCLPEPVIVQALKHASGFDGEHELCIGAKGEVLDRARDAVCAASEIGAVDLDGRD